MTVQTEGRELSLVVVGGARWFAQQMGQFSQFTCTAKKNHQIMTQYSFVNLPLGRGRGYRGWKVQTISPSTHQFLLRKITALIIVFRGNEVWTAEGTKLDGGWNHGTRWWLEMWRWWPCVALVDVQYMTRWQLKVLSWIGKTDWPKIQPNRTMGNWRPLRWTCWCLNIKIECIMNR